MNSNNYRLRYFTYREHDASLKVVNKDIPVSKSDLDDLEKLDSSEDIFLFLNGIVIPYKNFISLEKID